MRSCDGVTRSAAAPCGVPLERVLGTSDVNSQQYIEKYSTMRINKYLANQAYAATGADRMIQEGRVFKWAANRFGG